MIIVINPVAIQFFSNSGRNQKTFFGSDVGVILFKYRTGYKSNLFNAAVGYETTLTSKSVWKNKNQILYIMMLFYCCNLKSEQLV